MNIVIVVPTYNESGNIAHIIDLIYTVHLQKEHKLYILVVDSNSPDGTADIVETLRKKHTSLHILRTPKEGLGRAYIKGFEYAIQKLSADVVFEMDADLSHDPKEIPHFMNAIENGADFVIGTRYSKGGSIPINWGFIRKVFSIVGNLVIRVGFMKFSITDWTGGYRAIRVKTVNAILHKVHNYSNYVFQVALLDNALKAHAKVAEVPIQFSDRTNGESKINSVQYIKDVILYIIGNSSFVKFAIVGALGFIVDTTISKLVIYSSGTAKNYLLNSIGPETAVVSNYLLNNFWSFSHKRATTKRSLLKGFLQFNLAALGSIAIQTITVTSLVHAFGEAQFIWYKVGTVLFIILPYSYIIYNKFIWKGKK
jgi:dolichol-phosphate mannosyltransferase